MIENSTIKDEITTTAISEINYDYTGAMIYIVIVLLWYSIGIIFMLGMQMKARTETIEDSARRRTKFLIENLRNHTNTKEILEELVDKEKRARLWDIYLGTKTQTKDKLTRAETVRIRHIEKQLATMNRDRRLTNETLFPPENGLSYYRSRSVSRQIITDVSPVEEPITTLRRPSSLDEQTLERWKLLSNQTKQTEQMPWTKRKLIIRRYFRRHAKKRLSTIDQISTNNDQSKDNTNQLTRHHTEINLDHVPQEEFNDKQNPYLTYFYKSSDHHPSILTSEFFSTSSNHALE